MSANRPKSLPIVLMPGWRIDAIDDRHPQVYQLSATYDAPPPAPACKCGLPYQRWGTYTRRIIDSPLDGRRVFIDAKAQRYRCEACGKTVSQQLGGVDFRRRVTERCIEFIRKQALVRPNLQIAEEVGVDEKLVRALSKQVTGPIMEDYRAYAPSFLGIDDVVLGKATRIILIDLETARVIDLLEDKKDTTLRAYLATMPGAGDIVAVSMDMDRMFTKVVAEVLPRAVIIIDKWHVQNIAVGALEEARRAVGRSLRPERKGGRRQRARLTAEQKINDQLATDLRNDADLFKRRFFDPRLGQDQRRRLGGYLIDYPTLLPALELKEQFCDIWLAKTPSEAFERIRHWFFVRNQKDKRGYFNKAAKVLRDHQDGILAHFANMRLTNAKTEAVNGLLKAVNRAGRGYTFEQIRVRAILGRRPARRERKPQRRSIQRLEQIAKYRAASRLMPLPRPSGKHLALCKTCERYHAPLFHQIGAAVERGAAKLTRKGDITMICEDCRPYDLRAVAEQWKALPPPDRSTRKSEKPLLVDYDLDRGPQMSFIDELAPDLV